MSEARLLVVDDEPNVLELLSASLRFAGFDVVTATNGRDALALAGSASPDLLGLDVMMPGMDGSDVARKLRSGGDRVPVVLLTAKDATEDLTLGGDDYVTKPFSLEEVLARIRAVLRRTGAAPAAERSAARLAYDDLVLDDDTQQVWKAEREVDLSPTEFKLLRYLLQNPGRVLFKRQILEEVSQYDFAGDGTGRVLHVLPQRRRAHLAGHDGRRGGDRGRRRGGGDRGRRRRRHGPPGGGPRLRAVLPGRRVTDPGAGTTGGSGVSTSGSGLGLSIVAALVARGSVEVDGAPGRGTTVSVRLPAAAADGEPG